MSMRLDVEFPRPLDAAARTRLHLAAMGLAKVKRIYIGRSGLRAAVIGEALSAAKLRAALTEEEVAVSAITSSLSPEEDARLDDLGQGGERVKPVGR